MCVGCVACREAAERAAQQQAAHEARVAAAEAAKQAAQAAATAKMLQDRGAQVCGAAGGPCWSVLAVHATVCADSKQQLQLACSPASTQTLLCRLTTDSSMTKAA